MSAAALWLFAGWALLLGLFHAEAAAAVGVWLHSTAFGHCFLVLPIAGFLAWERRGALPAVVRAAPAAALCILPVGLVWFAADRLGIMEGRQLAVLAMAEVLALALLGLTGFRAMAVPLLYLVFLVPFGGFLTPLLQAFTTWFINAGLFLFGVPHVTSATVIDTPAGAFLVAEACAGLRFLIASLAYGVLFACTIYRSPRRRTWFIAASFAVPVVANGFRALGIVMLGQVLGSAQAASVDHVLYGWLFFSVVLLLLTLAGLAFREDQVPFGGRTDRVQPVADRRSRLRYMLAVAACLLVSLPWRIAAAMLDRAASGGAVAIAPDVALAGCTASGAELVCNGVAFRVRAERFSPATAPAALMAGLHDAIGQGEALQSLAVRDQAGRSWVVTESEDPRAVTAVLFETGSGGGTGLSWRLAQAGANLAGGRTGAAPRLMVVRAGPEAPANALSVLRKAVAGSVPSVAR